MSSSACFTLKAGSSVQLYPLTMKLPKLLSEQVSGDRQWTLYECGIVALNVPHFPFVFFCSLWPNRVCEVLQNNNPSICHIPRVWFWESTSLDVLNKTYTPIQHNSLCNSARVVHYWIPQGNVGHLVIFNICIWHLTIFYLCDWGYWQHMFADK